VTYGCHSRPRPTPETSYVTQTGWSETVTSALVPVRFPVYAEIKHSMSTDCRYDKKATDRQCAGCPHISDGKE
jgi:hypothetical protein